MLFHLRNSDSPLPLTKLIYKQVWIWTWNVLLRKLLGGELDASLPKPCEETVFAKDFTVLQGVFSQV